MLGWLNKRTSFKPELVNHWLSLSINLALDLNNLSDKPSTQALIMAYKSFTYISVDGRTKAWAELNPTDEVFICILC